MSDESGQLGWQSMGHSTVNPDVLSRLKTYNEIGDENSSQVTPESQPTVQSGEDAAVPYSSSSTIGEEFSSEANENCGSRGLSTPSYINILNNEANPNNPSIPFFAPDRNPAGQDVTLPSHSSAFLPTEDDCSSKPCAQSLPILNDDKVIVYGSNLPCSGNIESVDNAASDENANYGCFFRKYFAEYGFTRLSDSVSVERRMPPLKRTKVEPPHSSPVREVEKSPSEFVILAEKYILMGALDPSTIFAVHKDTREYFHVKSVPMRSAHEVVCQHALLQEYSGVRSPVEVVNSEHGKNAWLVFPPHYGDLHSYVRRKRRLRETEAQRLLNQIVTIVDQCHEAGLVLRDLKLRKFVFSDASRQEIILESLEDSVYTGMDDILHDKHGCPAYVAPEILTVSAFSGRLADMWGLGVILYTMLVGRYPFHNVDTATLFAKIRNGKYSIPEWVSTRARHLILSLLRRQPERRLSTRQVLSHPWLIRPPREHWTRDTTDHTVPGMPPKTM